MDERNPTHDAEPVCGCDETGGMCAPCVADVVWNIRRLREDFDAWRADERQAHEARVAALREARAGAEAVLA